MMSVLDSINHRIADIFIAGMDDLDKKSVRIQHGLLAGWMSVSAILVLFLVKLWLGLKSGSISVLANSFHLLSHLANSVILIAGFIITARPATSKTPFGHGRMEHVTPLIMSIFLFVSGFQLAETSFHQALEPHEIHYWQGLIWILAATIAVKLLLNQFVNYLGRRVESKAIHHNALHHNIEAVMSLAVIGGLIAGHYFHRPELDGYLGVLVSLWLLYIGFRHGKEAVMPLLGEAPPKELVTKIRNIAKSVEGVADAHEIIVHDYGSHYILSMHVEIPENYGPAKLHEITERCERKLRREFGGEAVCHTDPLMEQTPENQAKERKFKQIINSIPEIAGYHDFRVIAESEKQIIIAADLDMKDEIPESDFNPLTNLLEEKVMAEIPNVAYCSFYVTPKFAY
jgi:cation diffusion facilitator family transporter